MENQELKVKVRNEEFDITVQTCDPSHCRYDCLVGINTCTQLKSWEK